MGGCQLNFGNSIIIGWDEDGLIQKKFDDILNQYVYPQYIDKQILNTFN